MENKMLKCFMESFSSFLFEKMGTEVNGGISHHHDFVLTRTKQSNRSDLGFALEGFIQPKAMERSRQQSSLRRQQGTEIQVRFNT